MLKFFFYNYKQNKSTDEIITEISKMIEETKQYKRMEELMLFVSVPFISLEKVRESFDHENVKISATGFSIKDEPLTSDVTLDSLKEMGVDLVMTGLADSRYANLETSKDVGAKVAAALDNGLKCLFAVGEDKDMKAKGTALNNIKVQLEEALKNISIDAFYRSAILYKPLWAFGKKTEFSERSYEMEVFNMIRETAAQARADFPEPLPLIYGGRMNYDDAKDYLCKEVLDGVFFENDNMSCDELIRLICESCDFSRQSV